MIVGCVVSRAKYIVVVSLLPARSYTVTVTDSLTSEVKSDHTIAQFVLFESVSSVKITRSVPALYVALSSRLPLKPFALKV